jgi:hypothetical protein
METGKSKDTICYRFQCEHFGECYFACGTCCGIDDFTEGMTEIPDGSCTQENGYRHFRETEKIIHQRRYH